MASEPKDFLPSNTEATENKVEFLNYAYKDFSTIVTTRCNCLN